MSGDVTSVMLRQWDALCLTLMLGFWWGMASALSDFQLFGLFLPPNGGPIVGSWFYFSPSAHSGLSHPWRAFLEKASGLGLSQ